jgi:hypothetical protein
MSPTQWGPPTWAILHTLAEKITENSYSIMGKNLILNIIQICNNLPCPTCAQHAKEFWAKVNINNLKTKTDLINLLFVFHNMVNKRNNSQPFKHSDLHIYKTKQLIPTFNNFTRNFTTRGNMKLLNESFHRNIMLKRLRTWFMNHISHFDI